jgi:hypothetical protein
VLTIQVWATWVASKNALIGENMHPADELGKALSQARGIISSVINCYDRPEQNFVTGTNFIAEAMLAVEDILSKASANLSSLYEDYDLSVATGAEDVIAPLSAAEAEDDETQTSQNEEADDYQPSSFGLFGQHGNISRFANKLESIVETLPPAPEPMRPEQMIEQPAQNYEELLEKLTAMADSAAYHTQSNPTAENTLLPVLESLRNDVLRMRSVA